MLKRNQHRDWLTKNDPNEPERLRRAAAYQSASIKADITIALTFLQIAQMGGEGREAAKEKAERTVEAVQRLLPLIEDRLETADREWIQTRLAELQSALTTFDFDQDA
jgi:glutathione S-transferase